MAFTANYPPAFDAIHVKATSTYNAGQVPYVACNPATSLVGTSIGTTWLATAGESPQKFNIDLGSAVLINGIHLENGHHFGYNISYGINNFSIYGTNSSTAFDNVTYADTTDLVPLGTFKADPHVLADTADPQWFSFPDNDIAYRYYVLRIADDYSLEIPDGAGYIMGIRHIALQSGFYEAPPVFDPELDPTKLKLLIHSNTTNGDTTLVDASGNVPDGNVYFAGAGSHLTAQHKWGTSALYGSYNDRVVVDADFGFADNDFIIDWWWRPASLLAVNSCPLSQWDGSDAGSCFRLYFGSAGTCYLELFTDTSVTTTISFNYSSHLPNGYWRHCALTRTGNLLEFWINGVLRGNATISGTGVVNTPLVPMITAQSAVIGNYGYIDELRISVGTSTSESGNSVGYEAVSILPTAVYSIAEITTLDLTAPSPMFGGTDGIIYGQVYLLAPGVSFSATDDKINGIMALFAGYPENILAESVTNTSSDIEGTLGLVCPRVEFSLESSSNLNLSLPGTLFGATGTVGRVGQLYIAGSKVSFSGTGSSDIIATFGINAPGVMLDATADPGNVGSLDIILGNNFISMNGSSIDDGDTVLSLFSPGTILSMSSAIITTESGMFRYVKGRIE